MDLSERLSSTAHGSTSACFNFRQNTSAPSLLTQQIVYVIVLGPLVTLILSRPNLLELRCKYFQRICCRRKRAPCKQTEPLVLPLITLAGWPRRWGDLRHMWPFISKRIRLFQKSPSPKGRPDLLLRLHASSTLLLASLRGYHDFSLQFYH